MDNNSPLHIENSELRNRIDVLQKHLITMRTMYSKEHFDELLEDIPVPYHSLDKFGKIIRVNKCWCEMLEYEQKDVIGTFIGDYFSEKSLAVFHKTFPTFKDKGVVKNSEFEFITKSGKQVFVEVNGRIEFDRHGDVIVTHCLLPEVTIRKKIEQEIREAKQNWQQIFEAISSPSVILDPNLIITYANNAVIQASGLTLQELIGQPCCKIFHSTHVECSPEGCPSQKILHDTLTSQTAEMEVEAFNGTFIVSCTPILDEEGALQKIIHIATNITELKKYSDALEESERKFRDLTKFLPQTIYETDLQGNFTFVNNNGLEMFGYTIEDLEKGKNLIQMIAPEELEKAKKNMELLFSRGINDGNEYIGLKKDGTRFPIKIYTSVIYKKNIPTGLRGILIDISEQKRTEQIITEQKRVLESVVKNLPGFVYRCLNDKDATVLYISNQCVEITGYNPEDFINKSIIYDNLIAPEFRHSIWEKWQKFISNKQIFKAEYKIIDKNNQTRWVIESGNGIYDENDNLLFIEGYVEDTTEKKNIAESLEDLHQLYYDLVENSQDLIWQCDKQGIYTFINHASIEILGFTPNEMIGKKFTDFQSKINTKKDLEIFNQILNGKEISGFETKHIHKNGHEIYLVFNAKPVLNSKGEIIGSRGNAYDISQQKIAEIALKLSEDKYKLVVSNTPVVSFVIDKHGIFVLSEGKALAKLGLQPGQVVGMSVYDVYKDFPQITDAITSSLKGEIIRDELHILDIIFDILYTPIKNEQNEVTFLIGLAVDITDRKKSELLLKEKKDELEAQNEEYLQLNEELLETNQELYQAKLKAEESDRLKSAFLANLSHEIRTPMNAILGFSDLLIEDNNTPEIRTEYISIIQKSGNHLLNLINDLIDVAKIETGQVVPYFNNIFLFSYLHDLFKTMQGIIPKEKNIEFTIELENITSETILHSDEIKLRQILINLITNAIKFTETGNVKMICNLKDNHTLICKVTDTGIGIAAENFSIIFDRFRQIEGDVAIKKGGSGLGLAISKAYVEMLGGKIQLESKLGKGSTFTIEIPNLTNTERTDSLLKKKASFNDKIGNYETILVAEDDDINYYYLTKILSKSNYKLIRAINGEDAVSIFKNNNAIKLVLMDIKLPKMNGYEAANKIQAINPKMPIIAQTAYALSDEENNMYKNGFTDYISKPLKRDLLLSLIQKHIL